LTMIDCPSRFAASDTPLSMRVWKPKMIALEADDSATSDSVMVPTALMLPVTLVERILLISVVILVLIVEILNTAVEAAIDRQSFEINPLAKRAKDLGSAAVMLSLMLAGGVWASILWATFGRA